MTKIEDRLRNEKIIIAESVNAKEKECTKCGKTKTAEEFGLLILTDKTGKATAYLHSWCKECRRSRSKKQRRDRKDVSKCKGKDYGRWRKCIFCPELEECVELWSLHAWNTTSRYG